LLIRYRRNEDGSPVAKALVYTEPEHRIDRSRVDPDAIRIVQRLRENGHEAYIVGGAVRDLLLGRRPKDFDIVTDAQPQRIKRIFRNAHVIGRRFRLVHVYAGPKLFEVSTFRSIANGTIGNEYGTMDEDALRRDFTLNALYYDPIDALLIDYVGGFKDIKARRIKPVIPLATIFKEDPVRMIRCIKYAATSGFSIPLKTRLAIKRDASLLKDASASRLTEEFVKILGSGVSEPILRSLLSYRLLPYIMPQAAERLQRDARLRQAQSAAMKELDAYFSRPEAEKKISVMLASYLKAFFAANPGLFAEGPEAYAAALDACRAYLSPLNLPRIELETALIAAFKERGIAAAPKPRRRRTPRGAAEPQNTGRPAPAKGQAKAASAGPAPGKETAGKAGGPGSAAGEAVKAHRRRKPRRRSGHKAPGGGKATP